LLHRGVPSSAWNSRPSALRYEVLTYLMSSVVMHYACIAYLSWDVVVVKPRVHCRCLSLSQRSYYLLASRVRGSAWPEALFWSPPCVHRAGGRHAIRRSDEECPFVMQAPCQALPMRRCPDAAFFDNLISATPSPHAFLSGVAARSPVVPPLHYPFPLLLARFFSLNLVMG
jgi:hypothetical protein